MSENDSNTDVAGALDQVIQGIEKRRTLDLSLQADTSLQNDLQLSAEIGQALLAKQKQLEGELQIANNAKDQLLDRLAASYRDNAQLERRVERLASNLEGAEVSNRSLLSSLEEDRKTISRFQVEQVKNGSKKLFDLTTERDDLLQELEQERRSAAQAQSQSKRLSEKLSTIESKLASQSQLLEILQSNAKVSRSPKTTTTPVQRPTPDDRMEVTELMELIDQLFFENAGLRRETDDLHELLMASREQEGILRQEMEHSRLFMSRTDEEAGESLLQELQSPLSRSTSPTFSPRTSSSSAWASTSMGIARQFSAPSPGETSTATARVNRRRRPAVNPSTARNGQRSLSVDMVNRRRFSQPDFGSVPLSPLRPLALTGSVASSFEGQLNSNFYSNKYSPTPEIAAIFESHQSNLPTIIDTQPSPEKPRPSGITLSSPKHHKRLLSEESSSPLVTTQDAETQTDCDYMSVTPRLPYESSMIVHSDISSDHAGDDQIDNRVTALPVVIEQATTLLSRLKGADVASLEGRLKRYNLPGGVQHLAQTTMNDITTDIEQLRNQIKTVIEKQPIAALEASETSLITRKDLFLLIKTIRDVLLETGRLRELVNKVVLTPSAASSLKDLDTASALDRDALASAATKPPSRTGPSTSGLLAPLTRLLYGSNDNTSKNATPIPPSLKNRVSSGGKPTPKQMASSALAPAVVNVEFGAGVVRRSVSVAPKSPDDVSRADKNSLERRQGKGTRRDLHSIFAGGNPSLSANMGDGVSNSSWVIVPDTVKAPQIQQRSQLPSAGWRSQAANALIDSPVIPETDYFRTLRPRGLSDSSIHSTFLQDARKNPTARLLTPASLALSNAQTSAQTAPGEQTTLNKRRAMEVLSARVKSFQQPQSPTTSQPASSTRSPTPPAPVLEIADSTIVSTSPSIPIPTPPAKSEPSGILSGVANWALNKGMALASTEELARSPSPGLGSYKSHGRHLRRADGASNGG